MHDATMRPSGNAWECLDNGRRRHLSTSPKARKVKVHLLISCLESRLELNFRRRVG